MAQGCGVRYGNAMGELRLFAIGIDDARDVFAAPPELAERLRVSAAPLVPEPPRRRRRDALGPLMRKPTLPPSDVPLAADVENLLAGRFITPDRVQAAWMLVEHWLRDLSWGELRMSLTQFELDTWDFDLARAGMSSSFGIGRFFNEELGFPLRPLPGGQTGYVWHTQVVSAALAAEAVIGQLPEESAGRTRIFVDWCNKFTPWAEEAAAVGRPAPDLVALMNW